MTHRVGLDQKTVIQTAAELADSEGLDKLTLATLATLLHIRTPTLYHYVHGLDGLQRELALLGARQLAHVLGPVVMGRSGADALRALAIMYRSFAHEHPGLYAALQRAAAPDDTELGEAGGEVVEIVLRVVASDSMQHDTAIHLVRIIRSMLHGFVTLEINGGFGLPQRIDDTYQRLILAMIHIMESTQQHAAAEH